MTCLQWPPTTCDPGTDDELIGLVTQLRAHGYEPRPLPVPGYDVLLSRYEERSGFVDVLVLARYGNAVIARYEAQYDVAHPLEHTGRELWREELPPRQAVEMALRAVRPDPHPPGELLSGVFEVSGWSSVDGELSGDQG